ncbi:fimbrial protein FimV [Acinetobacter sp. YWS30-1]|uniref:fimbrial protein FimV n=1 Tax=Acinetobacter sp. YWS30-1 TaxID=2996862 RepID=UPI002B25D25D|nr:fimbrial protein FimV [Acinetobacter sp. YWS30-1]WPC35199.1 fimbrial protein FimV [Acinetobacter sp. YWS30-1]
MLIYVIPLVILIIVLIVVKKRQDAQESDKAKTKTVKAKKLGAASKSTSQRTKVVEPAGVVKKSATPLSAETRKKIEGLVQERNFFAAEAQINQALNRDNSQHELYLLLLDIHILQKDEFAISQLINHVRSLGLEDILAQAEVKKREFESATTIAQDTNNFSNSAVEGFSKDENSVSIDAFADLTTSSPSNELAFEQMQQEIQPSKPISAAESATNVEPLEFNFEPVNPVAQPVKSEDISSTLDNALEFDFQNKITENQLTSTTTESTPVQDFKLELEPSVSLETESAPATTEEIQPLDFSFSLDTPTPAVEKTAEPATEFDLSSLDIATPATETPGLDFKLDNVEAVKEAPVSTGVNFEIPTAPVTTAIDQHDPLVQSFPELMEVNEADLNLELAQQYIQLGAYAAAREVIAEREAEYTAAQRQQADQLLNQIAS